MQNVCIPKQKFHETVFIYTTCSAHSIFSFNLFHFLNIYTKVISQAIKGDAAVWKKIQLPAGVTSISHAGVTQEAE